MTFEQHRAAIGAAVHVFNKAIDAAADDGFHVKSILSGDGASLNKVQIGADLRDLRDPSVPPLPSKGR